MRINRENYMNHFTDFIIHNLPYRNLINTMGNAVIINNESVDIDNLFNCIYYHPLDLLLLKNINNMDKKKRICETIC